MAARRRLRARRLDRPGLRGRLGRHPAPERPDRGAFTAYSGGSQVDALPPTNRAAGQLQLSRLDEIVPGVRDVATWRFLRTDWASDPFTRGAYVNYPPGELTRFRAFFWIEGDGDEGAAQTGQFTAELVRSRVTA